MLLGHRFSKEWYPLGDFGEYEGEGVIVLAAAQTSLPPPPAL
jgi:hypothetical protein